MSAGLGGRTSYECLTAPRPFKDITIQRMDNVGIVLEDLEDPAKAFPLVREF